MKTPSKIRGFTLVELLTVTAVIGILATILIPVLSGVRENARRAKCLSNVRQIGLSLISAANQNKNQAFPSNGQRGWAWEVSRALIKDVLNQGGRDVFYCPSGMANHYPVDQLYNFNEQAALTGYVLLIPGTGRVPDGWTAANPVPDYVNNRLQSIYNTESYVIPASQRLLVVDALLSQGTNFNSIPGALSFNVGNHLAGNAPAGGHAAFVDGHVKWRKFQRGTSPSQTVDLNYFTPKTTGNPSFWF